MEGELMPWDGKHSLAANWPNDDFSGWMYSIFDRSIPDFDHDRFNAWIDVVIESRDPGLLLMAPLCTAAPTEPVAVKQVCVVGEELIHPIEKVELIMTTPFETIPLSVLEASKLVPMVDAKGKKVKQDEWQDREWLDTTKPCTTVLEKPVAEKLKGCDHASKLATLKMKVCPCQWITPLPKKDEKESDFTKRMEAWVVKRTRQAKRVGFQI
jgi:hypothetical protein